MRTCEIEGCERKHRALGYCETHYIRYRRNGDPGEAYIAEPWSSTRRYPLEPLCHALGVQMGGARWVRTIADLAGVNRRSVHRWVESGGIPEVQADRVCVEAGFSPTQVWGEWGDNE